MEDRSLLVSAVDNTLLGDDAALERFADWYDENRGRLALVYASGRFCDSVQASVRHTALPEPQAIIGGVGTEIRRYQNGQALDTWQRTFRDWDPTLVHDILDSFPYLQPQPPENQSQYKVSYYGHDLSEQDILCLRRHLHARGVRAEIIYSSARDLDVLPSVANKGTAACFLAEMLDVPCRQLIVSGNSGNDLAMFSPQVRGIVVANARPELAALSGANVYHSPYRNAAGVLDGLQHWLDRVVA